MDTQVGGHIMVQVVKKETIGNACPETGLLCISQGEIVGNIQISQILIRFRKAQAKKMLATFIYLSDKRDGCLYQHSRQAV